MFQVFTFWEKNYFYAQKTRICQITLSILLHVIVSKSFLDFFCQDAKWLGKKMQIWLAMKSSIVSCLPRKNLNNNNVAYGRHENQSLGFKQMNDVHFTKQKNLLVFLHACMFYCWAIIIFSMEIIGHNFYRKLKKFLTYFYYFY
jgi:hypothetical protein